MIIYDRLWTLLKEKNISQYALINKYGFSPAQITRLKHNEVIKTSTIDKLCILLDCSVNDIMEFVNDESSRTII